MTILRNGVGHLAAVCLGLIAGGASAQTVSINPSEDAFVAASSANSNYGSAGALGISGSAASKGIFNSVIKFNLSSVKTSFDTLYGAGLWSVQTVTLKLTATPPNNTLFNDQSAGQLSIVWMQDDSWAGGTGTPSSPGASGITYSTLPSFLGAGDQSLGTFAFDPDTTANGSSITYTLGQSSGLLGDIQSGSSASLELLAASSGVSFLFNSVNNGNMANRPSLTVTAVPVPEVSEWFLMGVGCAMLVAFRCRRLRHAR